MNTIGYDFRDTWVELGGFQFAVRLATKGNLYAPDQNRLTIERQAEGVTLRADGLQWAGGQRTCEGSMELVLSIEGGVVTARGRASHATEICRSMVLLVRGMAILSLVGESDNMPEHPLSERRDADTLQWPGREATMPLVMIKCENEECFALSRDKRVRKKAFGAHYDHLLGEPVLVLAHSEDARSRRNEMELPAWELGRGLSRRAVVARRFSDLEANFGMKPFDRHPERQWVKDLQLVVNLHGVHWTGYVFLTYDQQAEVLKEICRHIDGRRVLAFLPAWEGRYYVLSPECGPAEELGGEAGLRRLIDVAHGLGVRIIPMLDGPNLATEKYLQKNGMMDARLRNADGDPLPQNWCDWDSDLNPEKGGWLVNYGHPGYCDAMVVISSGLIERYDFDGIFLDGAIRWENSPDYSPYEGMKRWGDEMRRRHPQALLMAEDGYDLLWDIFGLFATSMQPLGIEQAMLRYTRQSWYLAYPAPGGSGGIHEQAWFSRTANGQMTEYIIPTFAAVDDTLSDHRAELEEAVKRAANWTMATPGYQKEG